MKKQAEFLNAILELEKAGINREITIQALKEAFESIIKKKNYEDIVVKIDIKVEEGIISIYNVRKIVEEVTDAALQVSKEEAENEVKEVKGAFIDDEDQLNSPIEIDSFTRADAAKFKSILKQKIKEAEKANIYAAYSDKVGELVLGYVEKVEPRYILINLGRTSVTLHEKYKIGDETFKPGDPIKVYLSEVNSSTQGPQITVSRSDKNFLKRLFEEEIHEVFSGVVVINDIARDAGLRSKVSVSSTDINVDPVGACIGQGGSKIQKICGQINREKVDIIQYHEYPGLFIAEALKPAQVIGVKVIEGEENKAIAVIKDGDTRVAIGTKGVNARLAVKLTHYSIDIMEQSVAAQEGLEYETIEQMKAKEEQLIFERRREAILLEQAREEEARKKRMEEELAQAAQELEEEPNESEEVEEVLPEEAVEEEKVETPVVEETKPEVKQEEKIETVEYKPVFMGQKISLSELEKQIEEEKKKNVSKPVARKFKKEEEVKEETKEEKVNPTTYMNIYTDEELEELENEEEYEDFDSDDEEIDYTEYDEYYDN